MKLIFGQTPKREPQKNPQITAYGSGPEGKRCMDCIHLLTFRQARTWYKCAKRTNNHNPTTDHGKTWQACGAFKEE